MAITKEVATDLIEVIGNLKIIEVRSRVVIREDGDIISENLHRRSITCGDLDASNNLKLTDLSGESSEVQGIAASVWTDEVKERYRQFLISQLPEGFSP
jgi:hypothetical protein